MWIFLAGIFVGALGGFVLAGLLAASRRSQDCADCFWAARLLSSSSGSSGKEEPCKSKT